MSKKRSYRCLATAPAAYLLCALASAAVAAQEPVERGQRLARQWCSGCHLVEPSNMASDVAPTFSQIAENRDLTPDRLRRWLSDPHPPMPNLSLSRAEIEVLVAYLESLRRP